MKNHVLPLTFAAVVVLCSCGGKKDSTTGTTNDTTKAASSEQEKAKPANLSGDVVCVWEGVPVYTEANKKSKYMTGISLGETVKYMGEQATDPADNNREYIKVELYDGKAGWAPTYGLVRDAKLGAVVRELSTVYKRPQLAAISDKKLRLMDIVAVGKTEQNFVEVTGPKKTITGWVHLDDITTKEDDVTAAVLALKMIPADATGDVLEAKLKEFLDAAPSGSAFYNKLNDKYNEILAAKNQVEEVADSSSNN